MGARSSAGSPILTSRSVRGRTRGRRALSPRAPSPPEFSTGSVPPQNLRQAGRRIKSIRELAGSGLGDRVPASSAEPGDEAELQTPVPCVLSLPAGAADLARLVRWRDRDRWKLWRGSRPEGLRTQPGEPQMVAGVFNPALWRQTDARGSL